MDRIDTGKRRACSGPVFGSRFAAGLPEAVRAFELPVGIDVAIVARGRIVPEDDGDGLESALGLGNGNPLASSLRALFPAVAFSPGVARALPEAYVVGAVPEACGNFSADSRARENG